MDEPADVPISATDAAPCSDVLRSRRIGRRLIGAAMATLLLILLGSVATVWILMHPAPTPTIVASFQADYQEGSPGQGWRYLWNAADEIGKTNGYRDLVWNGSKYGFDDNPQFPRPVPGHYVSISHDGGHPGHGKTQRGNFDTYVMAAYMVTNSGFFLMTNSFIMRADGDKMGDINVRVLVNGQSVGPEIISRSKTRQPFDRALGTLGPGDTVYVAVGPNGIDRNDHFGMDFALAWIPGRR